MNFNGTHLGSVKQENVEGAEALPRKRSSLESMGIPVVELSSSSESENEGEEQPSGFSWLPQVRVPRPIDEFGGSPANKRPRGENGGVILPAGFLDPLPPERSRPERREISEAVFNAKAAGKANCKQFWKAGDYEDESTSSRTPAGGIDHVRVHPKFLHSNATSHKWALGAFAELLDNALDEVCNGATFVSVGMLKNGRDGSPMLLIEDDGGGMDPDKMRQCMSLGYSAKSKSANTIGQYGNGFKTSTMRLGADVIVFSRCCGRNGKRSTQSIGMLSYTFLRCTGHEDIVVPMLDYEIQERGAQKLIRSTIDDWKRNLKTFLQWSPYSTEADLIHQFKGMSNQGTRIILYNLWEDDHGELELDFDVDEHDIQVRGANRDEKKIQMARRFPNSRHYLTYRHSLRSYASILYLRRPVGFRIILRGKDVEHHNLVNDLMYTQEVTYKPQGGPDIIPRETNMIAVVTIGFVKDAKDHIDVQGFNVYHKNRLIKPFWRIWNAAGSEGRGIIGVLEANFVEPAHDKQGFERTIVLARLESRLLQMQKDYWSKNCDKVGYVSTRRKKTGRDLVSIPREVRASESVVTSVMTPPVLKTRAEPIPLVTNSVPAVTGSSLGQVERRVHEIQVGMPSNLCEVLPKGISVLCEESQQSQIREVSSQGLNNPNQEAEELQRKSIQSEICTITGQHCLNPQLGQYSQRESSWNQPMSEVQCTSQEPLLQVQDTSHMEIDTSPNFLQRSCPSSSIASLLLCPIPRSDEQVELDETRETGSSIISTQILQFAEGAAINMIGSRSRDQDSIRLRLEDASAQNVIEPIELDSNSMNENVTINGNFGSIDSQSFEEIGQDSQLKQRIQNLEESQIQSIQMENERGENAETNVVQQVVGAAIKLSSGVDVESELRFEAQNINVGTMIGSSSGAQSAIVGAEIGSISSAQNLTSIETVTSYRDLIASAATGSSSRDQNAIREVEFNTSAVTDNVTNNDNSSTFDHHTLKQLEEENKQLKRRIQILEEIHLRSVRMEHERKGNLESHQLLDIDQINLENISKYKETMNAIFSAERLQRGAQEEELQNKLKNALLRIQELEKENNQLRLAQNHHS